MGTVERAEQLDLTHVKENQEEELGTFSVPPLNRNHCYIKAFKKDKTLPQLH